MTTPIAPSSSVGTVVLSSVQVDTTPVAMDTTRPETPEFLRVAMRHQGQTGSFYGFLGQVLPPDQVRVISETMSKLFTAHTGVKSPTSPTAQRQVSPKVLVAMRPLTPAKSPVLNSVYGCPSHGDFTGAG